MAKELYSSGTVGDGLGSSNAAREDRHLGEPALCLAEGFMPSNAWLVFSFMQIVLETPRLILRQFAPEDANALAQVISDPETMRYYPAPFGLPGVEDWIIRNRRRYETDGHGLWAMDLKSTGQMIGDCGITLQEVDGETLPEIGYHLRRDLWGQGLATEAARACRDYGFLKLGAGLLISLIRPENVASCRVAERNGMKIWKHTVRQGLRHCVYQVSREEWTQIRPP
jgi:RimJ/RimL family protein N-acetyltransferase